MTSEPFDFSKHRSDAISAYVGVRPKYEAFSTTIRQLLETCLDGIPIHTIEARAKDVSSFGDKAARPRRDDSGRPEYPNPLEDITDLAAARIIAYFPKTLQRAEQVIDDEFEVIERHDKSSGFETSGRLGYQSIHFLVRLRDSRLKLREYAMYQGLVAEIQLRTILQHAWAEMEHDIQYKSPEQIPTEIRRRFAALAGLIEIADREFQAIQDSDLKLHSEIRASLLVEPALIQGSTLPLDGAAAPIKDALLKQPSQDEEAKSAALVGDYEHAIRRYDELIEAQPTQFSHFLGRAKVRFLVGDRSGALTDLDEAERLAPGHPFTQSVRRKIDEGLVALASDSKFAAKELATSGHVALSVGDGETALARYMKAEELGFASYYCTFNKAMAYCLLRRHGESTLELTQLRLIPGSAVKVNCRALEQMNAILREPPILVELDGIRSAIEEMPHFDFSMSPLRSLISGLAARFDGPVMARLAPILGLLQQQK